MENQSSNNHETEVNTDSVDITTTAAAEETVVVAEETAAEEETTEAIATIVVTEGGFNLASDHGVDEETGQRALDLALLTPYFAGTDDAAVSTGTLIGPSAVTVPGVTGPGRDRPNWCSVEKIDHIDEGDPELGIDPEIWISIHTGNVPVDVEMTDGTSEPRYLVPVPVSALIPSTSRYHRGNEVPLLSKGGEKQKKQSKRGKDYRKGQAKEAKRDAKAKAGAKRAAGVVVREDTIEIEGEDVPCYRLMAQPTSGVRLRKGWRDELPNGGVFTGPQAKAKAKAVQDMILDALN